MESMMHKYLVSVAFLLCAGVSHAGVIDWADWTSSDLAISNGSIGSIDLDFRGTLKFAQLASGNMVGGGASDTTDYWVEYSPAPYTNNAVVDNRPPGFELLAFNAASQNLLIFSEPVLNPVMAIVSLGQSGRAVTYDFDTPFTVLSEGRGYWGDGSYALGAGGQLIGRELHGVIQFQGMVSQIGWSSTQEDWHGFTVGLARAPEPGVIGLVLAGLVGIGTMRRRRAG